MTDKDNTSTFVSLEDLVDDPDKLNVQLRLDLLRMVDNIRANLATGASIGIQGQQQLVQAIKLIKSLTSEINKDDISNGSSMTDLFKSLPFTSGSTEQKPSVVTSMPFDDGL